MKPQQLIIVYVRRDSSRFDLSNHFAIARPHASDRQNAVVCASLNK